MFLFFSYTNQFLSSTDVPWHFFFLSSYTLKSHCLYSKSKALSLSHFLSQLLLGAIQSLLFLSNLIYWRSMGSLGLFSSYSLYFRYKKLGYFQRLKTSKKVLKTVGKNIFNNWNDCREPLLKTVSRIFFHALCNRWKKYYTFIYGQ